MCSKKREGSKVDTVSCILLNILASIYRFESFTWIPKQILYIHGHFKFVLMIKLTHWAWAACDFCCLFYGAGERTWERGWGGHGAGAFILFLRYGTNGRWRLRVIGSRWPNWSLQGQEILFSKLIPLLSEMSGPPNPRDRGDEHYNWSIDVSWQQAQTYFPPISGTFRLRCKVDSKGLCNNWPDYHNSYNLEMPQTKNFIIL